MAISEHSRRVELHYDELTAGYVGNWNPDHIHLGLFEPEDVPEDLNRLAESAGLRRAVERMVDVIAAPAGIRANHRVVDAGCGVGGTAIYLANQRGCAVTGVNVNRKQLGIARQKATDAGVADRVRFEYADCSEHLPFKDGSVDSVINIESACHYGDRGTFLREVFRILTPGGRIAAMDWMARDDLSAEEYEQHILPLCKPWVVSPLERQSTYTSLLSGAGFEVVEFEGFSGRDAENVRLIGHRYRQLSLYWLAGVNTPELGRLIQRMRLLHRVWSEGFFELRRYCAKKPEDG